MFTNFETQIIQTKEATIKTVVGGKGEPLLLLHGYPQTYFMWHKIIDRLARDFTVIATDLRGYGDSYAPQGKADSSNYAKRVVAQDQVEVMSQLGFEEFCLVGHDRGGRVAHRLTLDYPEKVKKLAVLDIIPTYELYTTADREFATAYYHWFFLIQPFPLPEKLISADPEYFLRTCLKNWSKIPESFTTEALAEYVRCFSKPAVIHGTCEDYRASATVDLLHDKRDLEQKITCPLLVLWGSRGIIGKKYDVLASWQKRATHVNGKAIDCGHFLPEEAPESTYLSLKKFLSVNS